MSRNLSSFYPPSVETHQNVTLSYIHIHCTFSSSFCLFQIIYLLTLLLDRVYVTNLWSRVHCRMRWCLVRVTRVKVGIVGVVVGVVSLRVVVCGLPVALVVVVMAVVLVRMGRSLQVLVRVRVHVMVVALLLPRWHHLHHVAHGVHVPVGDGSRVVWKCCLQSLGKHNRTDKEHQRERN